MLINCALVVAGAIITAVFMSLGNNGISTWLVPVAFVVVGFIANYLRYRAEVRKDGK